MIMLLDILKQKLGYSLWETTIVLTVLGIATASYLELSTESNEIKKVLHISKQLEEIQEALDTHVALHGYLPCPAKFNSPIDTAEYGSSTDCAIDGVSGVSDFGSGVDKIRRGALPFKNLNLPPMKAVDDWNNRISYTVIRDLAKNKSTYDGYATASSFVIRIDDSAGNMINTSNTLASQKEVVAYTLVSHGRDMRGAYNIAGSLVEGCGSVKDSENCDDDNVFVETLFNQNSSLEFDDHIKWKTLPKQTYDKAVVRVPKTITISDASCEPLFNPTTFAPSAITGLILWLDANDPSVMYTNTSCTSLATSYTEIACWKDKSSRNFSAINTNSGLRPDWREINGYKTIRFNEEWLRIQSFSFTFSSVEVFVVAQVYNDQNGYILHSNSDNTFSLMLRNTGGRSIWTFNTSNAGSAWGGNTSRRYVWNAIGDNNLNDLNTLTRNEAIHTSTASNNSNVTVGTNNLFIATNSATNMLSRTYLYEMLIYDHRLTEDERIKVNAYLMKKWGI